MFTIPLGQALDLLLFQNLGPKIPIELEVTGFVNAELETKLTPLQINSMHIEPVVHLTVKIRTLVPFASRKATLKQVIPLGSGGFIVLGREDTFLKCVSTRWVMNRLF